DVGLMTFGADSHDPGHVFLPSEPLSHLELALLRTLPRVPEVTLATGLPVDRELPAGGPAELRLATLEFVESACVPPLAPTLATRGGLPPHRELEPVIPVASRLGVAAAMVET